MLSRKSWHQTPEKKLVSKTIKMRTLKFSHLLRSLLFIVAIQLSDMQSYVEARDKGGDDIILAKGKIIMRGGKGKGEFRIG